MQHSDIYAIFKGKCRIWGWGGGGGGSEFYQTCRSIHGGCHETPDGFRVNVEDVPLTQAHVTSPLNQDWEPELY